MGWLFQAQAAGLAAWWLLWGGFGRRYWEQEGISPRIYLPVLAFVWVAGWIDWTPGPPFRLLNLGVLAALTALAAAFRRPVAWVLPGACVLAVVGIIMRGLEPLSPSSASLVAWAGPESVVMGLLAALWGREPWPSAMAAGVGTGLASLWWGSRAGWGHMGLGPADWYYTVMAAASAWSAAALWDYVRPGRRTSRGGAPRTE